MRIRGTVDASAGIRNGIGAVYLLRGGNFSIVPRLKCISESVRPRIMQGRVLTHPDRGR